MRHKHADAIIAWANGEEIEYELAPGNWIPVVCPSWNLSINFRIKPKRVKKEGWVNVYQDSGGRYVTILPSKFEADNWATQDRVACIRIEWEETL